MRKSGPVIIRAAAVAIAATLLAAPAAVLAQSPAPAPAPAPAAAPQAEDPRAAEASAALRAGEQAGTRGPADIALLDQAVLRLPADALFIPKLEAARIMRSLGNVVHDASFVGLIVGTKPGDEWAVVTSYFKDGYIKDDDAKDWNADELLQHLKDGTVEANKERVARGFDELEVLGWVEKPAYDAATHRLVWSLLAKDKGEPDSAEKGINYNTYALGRDGHFSLNLLTSSDRVDADKAAAHALLAALSYNPGKRYEDFDSSTDRIAEYGLAALIGGVVAKKLGLFALIGVFVAKFAKVIGIAALALGAGVWNFFRRKPKGAAPHA
jgi:uncharacterized membrane-anchored protein